MRSLFLLAAVGIIALSLLPLRAKQMIGTVGPWHSFGHVAAFAFTGILYLEQRRPRFARPWSIWPIAALALITEALETAIYGNRFEWRDLGSDFLGLLVTVLVNFFRTSRASR